MHLLGIRNDFGTNSVVKILHCQLFRYVRQNTLAGTSQQRFTQTKQLTHTHIKLLTWAYVITVVDDGGVWQKSTQSGIGGNRVGRRVLTALHQQNCETICTSIIKHLRYPVHLFYIKHTGKWFAYLSDNLQTSSNGRWTQRESQRGRENNFVNYATLHRN